MITYELAKKLKDAGFPQYPVSGDTVYDEFGLLVIMPISAKDPAKNSGMVWWCKIPTLSELIEACGEKFGKLDSPLIQGDIFDREDKERWCSATVDGDDFEWGESPEQSVAKLWLLINKK